MILHTLIPAQRVNFLNEKVLPLVTGVLRFDRVYTIDKRVGTIDIVLDENAIEGEDLMMIRLDIESFTEQYAHGLLLFVEHTFKIDITKH